MKKSLLHTITSLLILIFSFQLYGQKYQFYPYLGGNKYGICDYTGKLVTKPSYDIIERSSYWKDYFMVKDKDTSYVIDAKGNIIFKSPFNYISLTNLYEESNKQPDILSRKFDFTIERKNFTSLFIYEDGMLINKTFKSFEDYKQANNIYRYYSDEIKYSNNAIPVAIDSNRMNFVNEKLEFIFEDHFFDGIALSNKLFALAKAKGQYHLYNREGKLLTSEAFTDAYSIHRDDQAILIRGLEQSTVSYLFTPSLKEIKLDINEVKHFSNTVLYGYSQEAQNLKLYDNDGNPTGIVLSDVYQMNKGLIMCKAQNGKLGLMDENAKWVLQPECDVLEYHSGGYYIYANDGYCGFRDSIGRVKRKVEGDGIYHHFRSIYKYKKGQNYGFVDTSGTILLRALFAKAYIQEYHDKKYFIVQKDQKWGILDAENQVVFDFTFDNIDFSSLEATQGENVFSINLDKKEMNMIFKHPKTFKYDSKSSKLLDLLGNPISNELYTECKVYNKDSEEKFFYTSLNTKQSRYTINEIYNYEGRQIIPNGFVYWESSFESLGLIYLKTQKKDERGRLKLGIINTNGEFIVGPSSNEIYKIGDAFICEYDKINKTKTLYDFDGKKLEKQYPFLEHHSSKHLIRYGVINPNPVKMTNTQIMASDDLTFINDDCNPAYLYGYLDQDGKEVVAPKYEKLSFFHNYGVGVYKEKGVWISEAFGPNGNSISKLPNVLAYYVNAPPIDIETQIDDSQLINSYLLIFEKSLNDNKSQSLFGLMTLNGEIKLPTEYQSFLFDGMFWHCQKNGKFIVLNKQLKRLFEYQGKRASVIKLSDRYYFVGSGVNLYILDLKTNKKIIVKDSPLYIEEYDENLLLLGDVNQPYHLRLDTGVHFRS